MVAIAVPAAGGGWAVLTHWVFDPVVVASILAAGSLYAAGLIRLRRRDRAIDRGAAAAFYAGLAAVVLALLSPLDAYADVSFTVHMGQHLVLTLLAPPLLALGAPITLALRSTSPSTARRISRVLGGRVASFLSRPLVGFLLFVSVPFVVHFSPMFDLALRSQAVHAAEHALWLGAALIYWWPIVGRDPTPHPVPHYVRLLSLFLAMPAMAFLAIAIYSASAPLYPTYASLPAPWGPASLASQRDAAVLMWVGGAFGSVIAMLIVAAAWKRDEDARQHRIEAREDAAAAARAEI
jgi:cytochrome c oxidase assembly factor CtaG